MHAFCLLGTNLWEGYYINFLKEKTIREFEHGPSESPEQKEK